MQKKLQLSLCLAFEYKFKALHESWMCREYVPTNLLCIQECDPKLSTKLSVLETERRWQPIHLKLLSWLKYSPKICFIYYVRRTEQTHT
jgi:hypothetical protein